MPDLSPFLPALGGGILIGLAAGAFHLMTGEIAGISGIARDAATGPERGWKLAFLAGLVAAGLGARWLAGPGVTAGFGQLDTATLLAAGLLVGFGSGLANGCTSGHGVCGLARLSPRSLAAVATFMITAGLTVFVVRHVVAP